MSAILGIDPGKSGGWAVLGPAGSVLRWGRSDKLDERDLADTVAELTVSWPGLYAIMERAQAFPKQGVSSVFVYGTGYGFWQGVLCANGIGYETVPARTWQTALGVANREKLPKPQHKRALIAEARRRWPELPSHSGVCDAALIACWGLRSRNEKGR